MGKLKETTQRHYAHIESKTFLPSIKTDKRSQSTIVSREDTVKVKVKQLALMESLDTIKDLDIVAEDTPKTRVKRFPVVLRGQKNHSVTLSHAHRYKPDMVESPRKLSL